MEHTEKTFVTEKPNLSGLPHRQPELLNQRKVLSAGLLQQNQHKPGAAHFHGRQWHHHGLEQYTAVFT